MQLYNEDNIGTFYFARFWSYVLNHATVAHATIYYFLKNKVPQNIYIYIY